MTDTSKTVIVTGGSQGIGASIIDEMISGAEGVISKRLGSMVVDQ